ncbi:MAG: helix-turn-helix domain-containing protein [Pseudomonadota bacterium]
MKITEKAIAEFSRHLFERVARKYGGDCTINELRVMNAAYWFSYNDNQCTPTLLAQTTGIPKSTVSRSLASLIDKGWLTDEQDAEDRRRRIIKLSEKSLATRSADFTDAVGWLEGAMGESV